MNERLSRPGGGGADSGGAIARLLGMCQRGEWSVVDSLLKSLDAYVPELSAADPESGLTPIMFAIKDNKIVIIEKMLDLGVNVNDSIRDGRTAIHIAAAYGKEDVMRLILSRKADCMVAGGVKAQLPVHMACVRPTGAISVLQQLLKAAGTRDVRLVADKDGNIPLLLAVDGGNSSIVKELLQHAPEQVKHALPNGDTCLHLACRKGDLEVLKMLVEAGADVNAQNNSGETPLHMAATIGDINAVKYFWQCKANANLLDKQDRSPLHIAAETGRTAVVELLVDKFNANILARTKDGSTLMHIASRFGHPETAQALLKRGVPLHMPNKSGEVSLHAAAWKGHVNVVRSLLNKGAHVDQKTKDGYTALHIAVEVVKPLVIQILLGYGADVELKGGAQLETPLHIAARNPDGGEQCAEMLIKSGANVDNRQENGETALHIAARYGNRRLLNLMLREHAAATAASKAGETPLHIAVRFCNIEIVRDLIRYVESTVGRPEAVMYVNTPNQEGETALHYAAELTTTHAHRDFEEIDIVKLLLSYEAEIGVQTTLTNETPFHYCSRSGNDEVLLEIIKYLGPSRCQQAINKQATNGWSPLLAASEQGHYEVVKILLHNQARVDVFDEHGNAALHLAAANGHEQVCDLLLWHKAFVNAKTKLGLTPLHLAAQNGYNSLVKLLVEQHGAAVDALTMAKRTPLHYAAQFGQMRACGSLLKMNGDATATDNHGQTPIHLAAESDHPDVVKMFLKHKPELVTLATADENGVTCAHIAAMKGSVAVIKELMRFSKHTVTAARTKKNNSTPLHLAAMGGHMEVVRVLLESGASPTDENAEGMTVVHLAAQYGHSSIMDSLKLHVNLRQPSSKSGFTALHIAAYYGQLEFAREMLAKVPATIKSEIPHGDSGMKDVVCEPGLTPLHLAALSGQEGIVRLLLNYPGVQVDAAAIVTGATPLHLAAQNGHLTVASLLLSKSTAQLHLKDKHGRTALHLAAVNGHQNMAGLLMGQGADLDASDKNNWTPLHYASQAGQMKVVQFLVESGASPTHETKDGKVALCYAAESQHIEVLHYLLKKEHNVEHLLNDKKFVSDLMLCAKLNHHRTLDEFVANSPAPVDTAAKLSHVLMQLSEKEKERAKDLIYASDFTQMIGTDLMGVTSGITGARPLLKAVDSRGVPLLDVLIETEQKEVVSHPAVQKYLTDVWMGQLNHWSSFRILLLFFGLLAVPPLWVIFSLPWGTKLNNIPVVKFMAYLVSHLYFLILMSITVIGPFDEIYDHGDLIPSWFEWLLLAWLSGMLVSELTNPGDKAGLGWLKVIIIGIGAISVNVHLLGFAWPPPPDTFMRFEILYIRNQLLGFGLFLGCVLIMEFLLFHHLFGPWAIIIRELMSLLMRFLAVVLLFLIGFTFEVTAVYQPAFVPDEMNATLGVGLGGADAAQATLLQVFEMLLLAHFGQIDPRDLPDVSFTPDWSVKLLKSLFAAFLVITIIVLINLLIAMMTETYQRIEEMSDVEWKFGRAKLIRNMNRTSATPSPLNLFIKLFTYVKVLFRYRGKVCTPNAQDLIDHEEGLGSVSETASVVDIPIQAEQGEKITPNVFGAVGSFLSRTAKVSPTAAGVASSTTALSAPKKQQIAQRIEDVTDWEVVLSRYWAMIGVEDDDETSDEEAATPRGHSEKPKHASEEAKETD